MAKKAKHGGSRPRAGRKKGKKAFKNSKPNPTKVMRIPLPLVEHIEELIEQFKKDNSNTYDRPN
jgi:hypothetical protein